VHARAVAGAGGELGVVGLAVLVPVCTIGREVRTAVWGEGPFADILHDPIALPLGLWVTCQKGVMIL